MFTKKRMSFFHSQKRKTDGKGTGRRRILAACLAGFLNGLLGTGGGVPLYFVLSKEGAEKKGYATASVGILLLSLQTLFLYRKNAVAPAAVTPLLPLLAVLGGAVGAMLLGKIPPKPLRILFALLLIGSGAYLVGKEIYFALFV